MKRLLCIMSNMNAGGAETFLMKIYREIDRTQYQMDFCVNVREKNYYEDEINELGGRIYRIPSRTENYTIHNSELYSLIHNNDYKYVLAISSSAASLIDLKIAKRAGAEVCSLRSSNSEGAGGKIRSIVYKLLRFSLMKYVNKKIAPSMPAAKYMFGEKAIRNREVIILPNGLNVKEYEYSMKERTKVRIAYGISDDTIVLGHIGRFNTQKNHMFLIDVFSSFHKKHEKSVLMLVGEGNLESMIRKKIEEYHLENNVIFTGSQKNIGSYLSAMDAFVFPSLYEGMPNTIIEAQANGLTCFISDTITKEANITGNVNYLSIANGCDMWVQEIEKAIGNKRMSQEDAFIKNHYTIQETSRQFVDIVYKE